MEVSVFSPTFIPSVVVRNCINHHWQEPGDRWRSCATITNLSSKASSAKLDLAGHDHRRVESTPKESFNRAQRTENKRHTYDIPDSTSSNEEAIGRNQADHPLPTVGPSLALKPPPERACMLCS
ncbi:hypothetical protein Nepgr_030506 [Nepenthes gracilis]|uniref:Uncharacterized protein n=1 Tax=Nepenthes gracilis TaxID=150966 RepID=A0AAD3Y4A3_NEPGR|nr:hypothetical protein Nepgr_030506 [Nepenthes gracilis]